MSQKALMAFLTVSFTPFSHFYVCREKFCHEFSNSYIFFLEKFPPYLFHFSPYNVDFPDTFDPLPRIVHCTSHEWHKNEKLWTLEVYWRSEIEFSIAGKVRDFHLKSSYVNFRISIYSYVTERRAPYLADFPDFPTPIFSHWTRRISKFHNCIFCAWKAQTRASWNTIKANIDTFHFIIMCQIELYDKELAS